MKNEFEISKANLKSLDLSVAGYTARAIPTGIFGLDGGSMFGTVPKVLWERSNPPDSKNRIPMEARGLLLIGNGRNILIDCGNGGDFIPKYGEKLGSKFAEMYNISDDGPSLSKSLKSVGLTAEDITDVVLTHLHFDHCGGATCLRDGEIKPTFPRAQYYVQKENYKTACEPNIREKASYYACNFEPLIKAGVLNFVEGNQNNLLPGLSTRVSNGHTKAHQMVVINDSTSGLVYCGDVVPTSSHVRLAWVMGYDLEPLTLIHEKTQILGEASDKGWRLYFEHDAYCDLAGVSRQGSDFAVAERFFLN